MIRYLIGYWNEKQKIIRYPPKKIHSHAILVLFVILQVIYIILYIGLAFKVKKVLTVLFLELLMTQGAADTLTEVCTQKNSDVKSFNSLSRKAVTIADPFLPVSCIPL